MMLKISLLFFISLSVLAKDCGPKPKPKANSIWVYEECRDKDQPKDCITLKDRAWTFFNVRRKRTMPLDISGAFIKKVKSAQTLVLTQTKESGCHFEKLTKNNLKRKLFFVVRGEIIASPDVHSKMSSQIAIPMSKEWPTDELLAFCQWVYKGCQLKK